MLIGKLREERTWGRIGFQEGLESEGIHAESHRRINHISGAVDDEGMPVEAVCSNLGEAMCHSEAHTCDKK